MKHQSDVGDLEYYVVFDPADESNLVYRWYGGQTVNIYDSESHTEIDVLELPDNQNPDLDEVQEAVSEHHYTVLQEMARDGDLDEEDSEPVVEQAPAEAPTDDERLVTQ